mmetsp:Transcript_45550/g.116532  ORF Transcript_45550/g.116532 Transcript_45550/m.116532 type:complete len:127 (+) Transcript_45550:342-722(+)
MERPDAGLLEGPLSWRRPGCGDRVALLRELDLTAATALNGTGALVPGFSGRPSGPTAAKAGGRVLAAPRLASSGGTSRHWPDGVMMNFPQALKRSPIASFGPLPTLLVLALPGLLDIPMTSMTLLP